MKILLIILSFYWLVIFINSLGMKRDDSTTDAPPTFSKKWFEEHRNSSNGVWLEPVKGDDPFEEQDKKG